MYVWYCSIIDSLSTELWCFAFDINFATPDRLALHVAKSSTHQVKERLLTLPATADCCDEIKMDSTKADKSTSVHVSDWLHSVDFAATIQQTVETAIKSNPRDVSKFAEDLKREMDGAAVPRLLHVVVVAATTTVMRFLLDAADHVTERGAIPLPSDVAIASHPLPKLSAEAPFDDYNFLDEVPQTMSDLTMASDESSPSAIL